MRKILSLLKPYIIFIVIVIVLTYFQVMINLKLPDYMIKIVNEGIIQNDNDIIYKNGLFMILYTLIGGIFSIIVSFFASRIATGYSKNLRSKIFSKIESFSINEFNKFSTSSLITRSTNDVQQIQMLLIMFFRIVLFAPIMAIGAFLKALNVAPSMSWIIGVAVTIMITLIITLFIIAFPKFQTLQKLVDKINLIARENLTGLRVVRAFNKEAREEEKFNKANIDLTKMNLFVNRLMIFLHPAMILILNFALLSIVWFGGYLIQDGSIQIGDMIAFMQYATQTIMSFLMISVVFIIFSRASASVKRVSEVLDSTSSIKNPKTPVVIDKNIKGKIEFKNVDFSYAGAEKPVLCDINFMALPGQTTAFIGSTGSGKSTLVNLIPRIHDVSKGQVLIDGIDVRDFKLEDLYKMIGYVPQRGILFSGTIKSNIKYGNKNASDSLIKKFADTAQATEFIDKLDEKFESNVAQGGANLSGGQKQRLSIARALAVEPKIFIFDDSFSALDFTTDAKLRKELEKITKNKTVLIVAQRIGTIMNADKIIVLDEGKIVGQGTHKELLKSSKVYREIAYSQLSEKELD